MGVFQPVVCASRVERPVPRAGDLSYLSIPRRPTVTRDPPPDLYRDVRDAYQVLLCFKQSRRGRVTKHVTKKEGVKARKKASKGKLA